MPNTSLTIEQVLGILSETPPRLIALTADLTPAQLRVRPIHDSWSATEVLAHMRACDDVWGSCISVMLAEHKPTLRAVNPRTWIKRTNYLELDFMESLDAFANQRDGLLVTLRSLKPEGWRRTATVRGAGTRLERSVLFYAQWLAGHERSHVRQIEHIVTAERVMAP